MFLLSIAYGHRPFPSLAHRVAFIDLPDLLPQDLSPAAVKLQRLLHATTRIRALFCCPGSALFSAQMSYLEIVACLACFAFSKKAESEFAECCISYLRVLHSMALELSQ